MELIRKNRDFWDPFDFVNDLQTDLNRAFNQSLSRRSDWARGFTPHIEVREQKDRYDVTVDLPGMKKEDLHISVEGNVLTLKGERKSESEQKEKGYFYSERYHGAFSRSVELPTEIQQDKIKATYKDGVLDISLPKSENAKPKQIDIEVK